MAMRSKSLDVSSGAMRAINSTRLILIEMSLWAEGGGASCIQRTGLFIAAGPGHEHTGLVSYPVAPGFCLIKRIRSSFLQVSYG